MNRVKTEDSGDNAYSDAEAERRAAEAIRRSFTMPYKPQKELIGKHKVRPASKGRARKSSRA